MKRSNKIKAAFLLLVFSMNTMVGLACSVGFNFGFKKSTSHVDVPSSLKGSHGHEPASIHSHEEVTTSHHDHAATAVPPHSHKSTVSNHDHEKPTATGSQTTDAPANDCEGDDCCTDDVVKLSLIDKALTSVNINGISLPQQLEFLLSAFVVSIHSQSLALTKLKPPNLRSWPPASHTDLRIVIQSFQI